jgi:transcriptional regulator with PAS, ATPase and Fis domain
LGITGTGLADDTPGLSAGKGLDETIEDIEKSIISDVLEKCGYNQSKAAKELKVNRTTLQYKITKYSIRADK